MLDQDERADDLPSGLAGAESLAVAGRLVARHLDAEAVALAHGLGGAVLLAALACRPAGRRLVIQRSHAIDLAGPLPELLALTGAEIIEIGSVDRARIGELERALDGDVAAAVWVADERLDGAGQVPLPHFRWQARLRDVPTIVIATSTGNWEGLLDAGVDLVALDASGLLEAPGVGLVAGKRDLVAAAVAEQAQGLGHVLRPAASLVAALGRFLSAGCEG